MIVNILGYRLERTCSACPEQYDVFLAERQVGYLRLRHGFFSVYCPSCDIHADLVYESEPKGDGIFEEDERMQYLTAAIEAIDHWVKCNKFVHNIPKVGHK